MSASRSRSSRVLTILERAQEIPPHERPDFVREACGSDAGLLGEVLELLALDDASDEALPGNARVFIDRFKRQLDQASRQAELRVRHTEFLQELLDDLREHGARIDRFVIGERLGRGGMGEVFRAFDRLLRRDVALKRVLADGEAGPDPGTQIRFLQEAQVAGQLDHPNVPPVHEIGIDDRGRLFFTMPLVAGQSLADLLASLPVGARPWEHPRVLDGLLHAARAVAHAHDRAVIHRDLKPANLMLGRFGAMQVMDWGIARVVDEERARAVLYGGEVDDVVASDLSEAATRDDAFETAAGSALGTPSYMSPEQASPDRRGVGPATDVSSLGAILYEALTGVPPYTDMVAEDSGEPPHPDEIMQRVRKGPPTAVTELAPGAPAELVAVCRRAMQRDPDRRFGSMQEFVRDLEAYLAGRVVRSYERGVWPELRKWLRRNRVLAAACTFAFVCATAGLLALANVNAWRGAESRRALAEELRTSTLYEIERLEGAVDGLWPARPRLLPELETWRADALALAGRLTDLEASRAELESRGSLSPSRALDPDAILHSRMGEAIELLRGFLGPTGPFVGSSLRFGPSVARRIAWAEEERRRVREAAFQDAWADAVQRIQASERYGGIRLAVDGDLLPLGENPRTGLWEFAHLTSGAGPGPREVDEPLESTSGIVLVLIPGGVAMIGARPEGWDDPFPKERPVHAVPLAPYFVSKFELTRAQWERIAGYVAKSASPEAPLLPVTKIGWEESRRALAHVDLRMPTEAQWEHAARGGTETTWWPSADPIDLYAMENVNFERASSSIAKRFRRRFGQEPPPSHLLPVDAGSENPFGLLQTLGNVKEWCGDWFGSYELPTRPGDGERLVESEQMYRTIRGGSFTTIPYFARVAKRNDHTTELGRRDRGVRPVRLVRLAQ